MIQNNFNQNQRDITFPVITESTNEAVIAALMIKLNAYVSIGIAKRLTTLDKTTQYRERVKGNFPQLVSLTPQGRRKAYRIQDLKRWLDDPSSFQQSQSNSPHS